MNGKNYLRQRVADEERRKKKSVDVEKIAGDDKRASLLAKMPDEVEWRTGLFGAMAGVAAFSHESDEWLDALLAAIDENRRLLGRLLAKVARTTVPRSALRGGGMCGSTWGARRRC